jgi:hypothetical protein
MASRWGRCCRTDQKIGPMFKLRKRWAENNAAEFELTKTEAILSSKIRKEGIGVED